jgi:hypothetical protein
MWISWGTAPRIPYLTLHERLYFRENGLLVCPLERTLRGVRNWSACFGCEKALLSQAVGLDTSIFPFLPEIKPWFVCRPSESSLTFKLPFHRFVLQHYRFLSPSFKPFPSLMSCSWRFVITRGYWFAAWPITADPTLQSVVITLPKCYNHCDHLSDSRHRLLNPPDTRSARNASRASEACYIHRPSHPWFLDPTNMRWK